MFVTVTSSGEKQTNKGFASPLYIFCVQLFQEEYCKCECLSNVCIYFLLRVLFGFFFLYDITAGSVL